MGVWCVGWRHYKTGKAEWCATYGGRLPTEDARDDRTRCGARIIMRIGSKRRLPTCRECKAKMARAKAKREKANHG